MELIFCSENVNQLGEHGLQKARFPKPSQPFALGCAAFKVSLFCDWVVGKGPVGFGLGSGFSCFTNIVPISNTFCVWKLEVLSSLH